MQTKSLRFLLLLGVTGTFLTTATPAAAQDWAKARDEAVANLQALVRLDTSDPATGNELTAVRYIEGILTREGIESHVYEKEPGRGNIVARLKGSGVKRPLLLMGHIDVVGVERDLWTADPFSAEIRDGYVWGRGSQDDKGMTVTALQVFLMLKRANVPLDRDIIFMANSGEEGNPSIGVQFMAEEHFDEIDAEFALNEGGSIESINGRTVVSVGTSEKVGRGMRLTARGTSGHASRPLPDNAIVHLAAAVAKFGTWQYPMRLNETTRAYFKMMADVVDPERADLYRNLENPARTAEVQEKLRLVDPNANSMIRTSISPTIIEGGFRSNVIPAEATVRLDIRALPDDDPQWLAEEMRKVINDPAIEIAPPGRGRPVNPPMPMDSDLFRALQKAQEKVFPGGLTVPTMGTGATDSSYLRAKGILSYGLGVPKGPEGGLAHGNDERATVEGIGRFVQYLYQTVIEVAGR
jgi:acetylornithine deacetylase/succinyl-diaminopimelate desuccinylase-like protein